MDNRHAGLGVLRDVVEAREPVIERVPNVSEGRDAGIIRRLVNAVESGGAGLLDIHSDVDHHRSVFTIVGDIDAVERSVLALARTAVELVDLTKHRGVHPRIGAIDVDPFVPLRASNRDSSWIPTCSRRRRDVRHRWLALR